MVEVSVDFCLKSKVELRSNTKVFKTNTSFLINEMNKGRGQSIFKLVALFDKYFPILENSKELKINKISSDDLKIFKKLNRIGYINLKKTKLIFKNTENLLKKSIKEEFVNNDYKLGDFSKMLISINRKIELPLNLIDKTSYIGRKKEIRKMIYAYVMSSLPKESGLFKRAKWLNISRRSLIENAIENNPYLIREKRYIKLGFIPMAHPKDKLGIEQTKIKLNQIHRRFRNNNLREGEGNREFTSYAFVKKNNRKREYEILSVIPNAYEINKALDKEIKNSRDFVFQRKKLIKIKKLQKKTVYQTRKVQIELLPKFIELEVLLKNQVKINSVSTKEFFKERYKLALNELQFVNINGLEYNTLSSVKDLIYQDKSNSVIYEFNNNINLNLKAA